MHPHFAWHQITPKTSRNARCSISMLPNVSINGRIRSSGQLGRWWYSARQPVLIEHTRLMPYFAKKYNLKLWILCGQPLTEDPELYLREGYLRWQSALCRLRDCTH